MTIRYYFLISISFVALLSLGSYVMTKAYFTDTAVSASNTFVTAEDFVKSEETPPQQPELPSLGKLMINEVFIDGGQDSEWIELFNSSTESIDITGWKIKDNGSSPENLVGSIVIPAESYAVIVASESNIEVPSGVLRIESATTLLGNGLTPDDNVRLLKPDNSVYDGLSWGNDTGVFTGLANPASAQSIKRIPNGKDTDTASDWQLGAPTIGASN